MRFEYFLRALQNSMFIIGNSSSGIKEAPFFGVPSINVGTRQFGRASLESISNVKFNKKKLRTSNYHDFFLQHLHQCVKYSNSTQY